LSVFAAEQARDQEAARGTTYKVFRNAVIEMMKTIVASSIQFCTVTPHTVISPVNKSAN
jgi:hypothetical protein